MLSRNSMWVMSSARKSLTAKMKTGMSSSRSKKLAKRAHGRKRKKQLKIKRSSRSLSKTQTRADSFSSGKASKDYPRVEDGDKNRILEELKKLMGTKITGSIISALPKEGKLIFSEKDPNQKEKKEIIERYKVGEEIDGTITGIVDFGVFVKVEDGLEGLVHISEIDWALVEDPRKLFKVGDKVKVKIIEIKDGKVSLSIKALKENPWKNAEKKFKKGEIVKGVVIKFNQYGALVAIEEGVAGLVHVSEFGSAEKLRAALELGKTYTFQIIVFEPKDQKMTLAFIDEGKKKE